MFIIKHRRRRNKKTDYKKRLALVKSGEVRLVVRRSLKNITVQFIEYDEKGDKVISSASSKQLKKHGWNCATGNIPAAYLTGLLAGKTAKVRKAVLDMGLQASTKGSRIYSAVRGVIDAGVGVAFDEKMIVPERIDGSHIEAYGKINPQAFKKYKPEEIKKNFEETKQKIMAI